jgi:hypothetical protein
LLDLRLAYDVLCWQEHWLLLALVMCRLNGILMDRLFSIFCSPTSPVAVAPKDFDALSRAIFGAGG